MLLTQACPSNQCVIGSISLDKPVVRRPDGIDIVTFDMGATNVPADIPKMLNQIRFVRLDAGGQLGLRNQSDVLMVH